MKKTIRVLQWISRLIVCVGFAVAIGMAVGRDGAAAEFASLGDLERERSIAIAILLDPDLSASERELRMRYSMERLVEFERSVLTDKPLRASREAAVRKAFRSYDLTFLVHGSVENGVSVVDQWMTGMGLTTGSIMSAREGGRW